MSNRGSNPPVARTVLHPVRNSRFGAGPRGARAPDVIAARRRLSFCYFAGEVVGANGFRAPITDSPSRGPAHLLLFGRGAAMVSRPGGHAATEALQAGCRRGTAAVRGGEDRAECSGGDPRLGCGAHHGRSVQGCGCYAALSHPAPRLLGEGRKEEEC